MQCVEDSNGNVVAIIPNDNTGREFDVVTPAPQADLLGQPIKLVGAPDVQLPKEN